MGRGVNKIAKLNQFVEWTNFAFHRIKIRLETPKIAKRGEQMRGVVGGRH